MEDQETESMSDTGTRYPFVKLDTALDRAKKLYEAAGDKDALIADAFQTWGYSGKSSGGFQTVAALKMYGLVRAFGAAEARKLALTADALLYFREERPERQLELRKKFALAPALIAALWTDWKDKPPADHIARSHLKVDRKLSEQSARSLLGIYKENLDFAKLKASDKHAAGIQQSPQLPTAIEVGNIIQWEADGVLRLEKAVRVRAVQEHEGQRWVFVDGSETGIPMEQAKLVDKGGGAGDKPLAQPPRLALEPLADWREEQILDEKGDPILIRYKGEPSKARYEFIRDYFDFKLKRLKS